MIHKNSNSSQTLFKIQIKFKTIKVKIGEKFDLFESVPAKNFTLHTKQWVFARSRTNSEGSDGSSSPLLKVPLKTIAPVGSLDAKHWYFGDLSRADCNATLRARYYPKGTFIIRKNGQYREKYSLSVISRAKKQNNDQSQVWFPMREIGMSECKSHSAYSNTIYIT